MTAAARSATTTRTAAAAWPGIAAGPLSRAVAR